MVLQSWDAWQVGSYVITNPAVDIASGVRDRVDVAGAVDSLHTGFDSVRDRSEGTGNLDPVIGIPLVSGVAIDVASGTHGDLGEDRDLHVWPGLCTVLTSLLHIVTLLTYTFFLDSSTTKSCLMMKPPPTSNTFSSKHLQKRTRHLLCCRW